MNWRRRQRDRTFAAASPNERARRIEPRCLLFDNCSHRRARPGPPRCGRSERAEFDATRIKSASMMSMNALQLEAAMKAYTDNRAKNGSPIVIYMALSMRAGAIRRPVSCTSEATQGGRASIVRVADVSTSSVADTANRGDTLNIANKDYRISINPKSVGVLLHEHFK